MDQLNLPLIDTSPASDTASIITNIEEIKLQYTRRLIPIFCKVFLNCIIQSINKACLNLLRKLINCASKDQLNTIVQLDSSPVNFNDSSKSQPNQTEESNTISALLVELISKVLQENQNYESILIGLSISNDLFRKCSPFILEEFTRLGVGHLISQLAVDTMQTEEETISAGDETSQVVEGSENNPIVVADGKDEVRAEIENKVG